MLAKTLVSLIHHCAKTKAFRLGVCLHGAAIKTGTNSELFTANHILNFYAKCGHMKSAHQLLDEMSKKNLVTWSAIISGYDQANKPISTLALYSQMLMCFKPNDFIFASALSSCAEIRELNLGRGIHAQSVKLGCVSISFVINSLILMYMKCGMCDDALLVYSSASESGLLSLVSYNVVITGVVDNGDVQKGVEIFKGMHRQDMVPDHFTFVGLIGSSGPGCDLYMGMQLHCQIVKLGLDCNRFTGNVLLAKYSKFKLIEEADKVFRCIEEKDIISWNTVISACCHCESDSKALSLFREMVANDYNVKPDDFTYASVLSAAAGLASMRLGREIHAQLVRTRLDWDVEVGNSLINMYAKGGCIDHAYTVFNRMVCRNLVSWNSIIAAFANHGLAKEAIRLFEEMNLSPDSVTFLALLTACNHSGLANEGREFFTSMSEVYGIAPSSEHLCCLIDSLGRTGKVNEAEEYAYRYPVGDDPVVLGCLLSACRLHGDIVVGERVANRLLKLHPVTTSPYILLSNLYALDRKWDDVAEARKLLQGSGLKKEAAHSLIEVLGSTERFVAGDFSHPRMKDILELVRTLNWREDEELLSY